MSTTAERRAAWTSCWTRGGCGTRTSRWPSPGSSIYVSAGPSAWTTRWTWWCPSRSVRACWSGTAWRVRWPSTPACWRAPGWTFPSGAPGRSRAWTSRPWTSARWSPGPSGPSCWASWAESRRRPPAPAGGGVGG